MTTPQTTDTPRPTNGTRLDLLLIADMVAPGSRVLDVGCGDGTLLELLERTKEVDGRGVEISQAGVNACVARGLSVIQGDADKDLADYPDNAFDYVVLSQTIQATQRPKEVLRQLLRIGRRAIVSFPNFGHWTVRLSLTLRGRMPMTRSLGEPWYSTENIHYCTIRDFTDLCADLGLTIEQAISVNARGGTHRWQQPGVIANLFGTDAVFLLSRD